MRPIVSTQIRLRRRELLEAIGDDSIIDDFCYISARVRIGHGSHIAAGCTIAGGPSRLFAMGDLSSLSAGVTVWVTSNDYARDLVTIVPQGIGPLDTHTISGDVTLENYTGVGANSVIMPDCVIPEGTVIGALSFVPAHSRLKTWSVYAGTPIQQIGIRDRESVLAQVAAVEAGLRRRDGDGRA